MDAIPAPTRSTASTMNDVTSFAGDTFSPVTLRPNPGIALAVRTVRSIARRASVPPASSCITTEFGASEW